MLLMMRRRQCMKVCRSARWRLGAAPAMAGSAAEDACDEDVGDDED